MADEIPQLVTDLAEATAQSYVDRAAGNAAAAVPADPKIERKIPVSIITGYLGSGKSTLLERIGKTSNKRLAIILNEFGDSSVIEKSVTIQSLDNAEAVQEWLDLGNGCLCCTVKDNGVVAIEQLLEKLGDKIDYILLETTGVADPAPIAKMFWLDDALNSRIYIDGVVTVVDAEHIERCLDDVGGHWHRENNHLKQAQSSDIDESDAEAEQQQLNQGLTTAHLQIAMADTILINKIDKIPKDDHARLQRITQRVQAINLTCPIHTTSFGDIALDKMLDLHAFECRPQNITLYLNLHTSFHDPRVATISLEFPFLERMEQFKQVESFLQQVLWGEKDLSCGTEIHRLKGLIVKRGDPPVVKVIQGVRETYDIIDDAELVEGVTSNKLVFIGKALDEKVLREKLEWHMAAE